MTSSSESSTDKGSATERPLKTMAIITPHDGWMGQRFQLSDEASLGGEILGVESLTETLRDVPPSGALILTTLTHRLLTHALKLYWTELGQRVSVAAAVSDQTREGRNG